MVITAPHRSCGKTTVSVGLLRALTNKGLSAQPFKKGPDYIDPMWMTSAARRDCRNLDFYMMGDENILRSFQSASPGADIALIEGNLGLYDGIDINGTDSTAGLAHLLDAPVVIVVDTWGMNRGVAPLLTGYRDFDPELSIAGVILNRVSSPRHESKLVKSIERHVGMEILGVIPKAPDQVGLEERHMGLVPVKEDPALAGKIGAIGEIVGANVDLDRLTTIAATAGDLPMVKPCPKRKVEPDIRIGVALDRAFTFYYPECLEALESAGAEIVPFSPLEDSVLPEVNGLYIGGGFPEVFIKELEANQALRRVIKSEIDRGLPVYAECGGMMYLTRSIEWNGLAGQMVSALDCAVEMTSKPMGLGYMTLEATGALEWFNPASQIKCHEFHHSRVTGLGSDVKFAWRALRGSGIAGGMDGIIYKNTIASYAHLHSCGAPTWGEDFAAFIRKTGLTTGG